MSEDLATLDAVGSAELVRKGEISPVELVDAAIARIEKRLKATSVITTIMFLTEQVVSQH